MDMAQKRKESATEKTCFLARKSNCNKDVLKYCNPNLFMIYYKYKERRGMQS